MDINLELTIAFGAITAISTGLTIYYGRKSAHLEKTRKKLEWTDIQSAASELSIELKKAFIPDLVLTLSPRGGMIAFYLLQDLGENIPILVGVSQWRDSIIPDLLFAQYDAIETNKWLIFIPKSIYEYKSKRLLVVDDFAMSGEGLEKVKSLLVHGGYSRENIKTLTVVITEVAAKNHRCPDFFWMKSDTTSFYFPWGKAR